MDSNTCTHIFKYITKHELININYQHISTYFNKKPDYLQLVNTSATKYEFISYCNDQYSTLATIGIKVAFSSNQIVLAIYAFNCCINQFLHRLSRCHNFILVHAQYCTFKEGKALLWDLASNSKKSTNIVNIPREK